MDVRIVSVADQPNVYRLVESNPDGTVKEIHEASFREVVGTLLRLQNPNSNLRIRVDNRRK